MNSTHCYIYSTNPSSNDQGNTPLLSACGSGLFDMAKMLIDAGALVNKKNIRGNTPLLAACAAGNPILVEYLLDAGAETNVVRQDGACAFAVAVMSDNAEMIDLVFKHHTKRLESGTHANVSDYLQQLAHAFLSFSNVESWLRLGATSHELQGEVAMLLSSPAIEESDKRRLVHLRAFLHHHSSILYLKETPPGVKVNQSIVSSHVRASPGLPPCTSPVPSPFGQLVSQAPESLFRGDSSLPLDALEAPGNTRHILPWLNKPHTQYPLLWMRDLHNYTATCLTFSPVNGSMLAYAEGNNIRHYTDVVLCNLVTGFEVRRLTGHMG
jgi:hypothetical protein